MKRLQFAVFATLLAVGVAVPSPSHATMIGDMAVAAAEATLQTALHATDRGILAPVPEPGTGLLLIAGLLGLARWRRARA